METFNSKHPSIAIDEAHELCSQAAWDFHEKINEQSEFVKVNMAYGRVNFCNVVSEVDYPLQPTSMMDGYAVNFNQYFKIKDQISTFKIAEKIYADCTSTASTKNENDSGATYCVYVTTGSPVPSNYDTVIPVEWIGKIDDDIILLLGKEVNEGMFIRPCGANFRKGETIIVKGKKIDEFDLTALISLGISEVRVLANLVVGIMSNGDELKNIFDSAQIWPDSGSKIYDSNKFELTSLLQRHFKSIRIVDLGIIKDTEDDVEMAFEKASFNQIQILISTGSVSMGEKDYVKKHIEKLASIGNSKLIFGRVNMKPGMPTTLAINFKSQQMLFFGLSGNPVSCVIGYYLFVKPSLETLESTVKSKNSLTKNSKLHYVQALSLVNLKVTSERPELIRSTLLLSTQESKLYVIPTTLNQMSSSIKSLLNNFNCLIRLPCQDSSSQVITAGTSVPVIVTENILIKPLSEIQSIKANFEETENFKSEKVSCFCGMKNDSVKFSPVKIKIGILVISDKLQNSLYAENKALLNFRSYITQNRIKENYTEIELPIVGNEFDSIKSALRAATQTTNVIITSGGTGVSEKDITPEVTKSLIEKECTGISQLIMQESVKLNKFCSFSRATCGIFNNSFILNLPGNPNAVSEILDIVEPLFGHLVNQIKGIQDFH